MYWSKTSSCPLPCPAHPFPRDQSNSIPAGSAQLSLFHVQQAMAHILCIISFNSYFFPQCITIHSYFLFTFCISLPISFSQPIVLFLALSSVLMPGFHGNATYESNSWGAVLPLRTARTFCPLLHMASIGMKSVRLITISREVEQHSSYHPKVLHSTVVMLNAHFMPFPYCIYIFMDVYGIM